MPDITFTVTAEQAVLLEAEHDRALPDNAGDPTADKIARVGRFAKKLLFDRLVGEAQMRGQEQLQADVRVMWPEQPDFEGMIPVDPPPPEVDPGEGPSTPQ